MHIITRKIELFAKGVTIKLKQKKNKNNTLTRNEITTSHQQSKSIMLTKKLLFRKNERITTTPMFQH